jgi:SH3-like domain-containing protein
MSCQNKKMSRRALFFLLILFSVSADALCVSSSKTHLRSGPGSRFPITWTVLRYTPLMEISRNGSWIQVSDVDGIKHWVYGANVSRSMICVTVAVPQIRLRKSPDPNAEVSEIKFADKYSSFRRIDVRGEWVEVESFWGETFWLPLRVLWRPVGSSSVRF